MKITIVDGERPGSNWEMEIEKFDSIQKIRNEIGKLLNKKENKFFIYKNIILRNYNWVSFYKICPNDEIWWVRIENYLKCDDVILDILLVSRNQRILINLIVDNNKSIDDVRLILYGILPDGSKIIDIRNDEGKSMETNNTIRGIDTSKGERRIICRWLLGDFDLPFDESCDTNGGYLKDRFWIYQGDLKVTKLPDETEDRMRYFREIVKSIVATGDARFFEDLASMAMCLQHSISLCCRSAADYICDVLFYDEQIERLSFAQGKCRVGDELEFFMFECYLYLAICVVVHNYVAILSYRQRQQQRPITNYRYKYIRNIIWEAMEQPFVINSANSAQYLMTFIKRSIMKGRECDLVKQMTIDTYSQYLHAERQGLSHMLFSIPSNSDTILKLREAISIQTRTPLQQIYLIDNYFDIKPKDEDTIDFDELFSPLRYSWQLIQSMDDIDVMRGIGQGSFSKVFLCKYKISEEQFALKTPIKASNLDREIIIHTRIGGDSSNICRHRGLFVYRGDICSAMDYKPGGTLDELIKKRKFLQEHEIAKISLQILTQIKEMHNHKVIHRDIKPANIVLDEHDNVYLVDFGISKIANKIVAGKSMEISNKSSPGTAHYCAPELSRLDSVTEKIDTWSFGVMVIEMVNGRRPNHELPDHAVLSKINKDKCISFELPNSTTEELRIFIYSCVEFNPTKRLTIDELIQTDFIRKYCDL